MTADRYRQDKSMRTLMYTHGCEFHGDSHSNDDLNFKIYVHRETGTIHLYHTKTGEIIEVPVPHNP